MGGSQSALQERDALKDPELVSKKVADLKHQGERMSKALFTRLDEVGAECQKALADSESWNNSHVAAAVFFRLASVSELLDSLMLKFCGPETLPSQTKLGEQLISSLLERIEKLEESNVKLEKMCLDNKASCTELTKLRGLEKKILELQSNLSSVTEDMSSSQKKIHHLEQSTSIIPELEDKLKTVTTEMEACRIESKIQKDKIKSLQTLALDSASLGSQLKKMKSKHKALKQQMLTIKDEKDTASLLFAKKISSLEKLGKILNKDPSQAGAKPKLKMMDDNVHEQILSLQMKVDLLQRHQVGFTVKLPNHIRIFRNTQVRNLLQVINNNGYCFEPYSGHFVAPYNGLYCFCIKLEGDVNHNFTICLMSRKVHKEAVKEYEIPISINSPISGLCVLYLFAQERVFVNIATSLFPVILKNAFTFSGWSIGFE